MVVLCYSFEKHAGLPVIPRQNGDPRYEMEYSRYYSHDMDICCRFVEPASSKFFVSDSLGGL